ncbi:MAG: hypothetical protein Q9O62_01960 [Ardenticatenia bacterium]|nr:hypothetical protein [Ardenticatenia bacterium]
MRETPDYYVPPNLKLKALQSALGVSLLFFVFYIAAHYVWDLPFPTPVDLLKILMVASAGVGLGVAFSRFWPLPPAPGVERIVRTLLLVIPALGVGIGLQLLVEGAEAQRAFYLIFAFAAWVGSGFIVRYATN